MKYQLVSQPKVDNNRTDLKNHVYMNIAHFISTMSTCNRRMVGCVIVSPEGFILSTGYNGSPSGMAHCKKDGCILDPDSERCIRSIHAETNAIISASRFGVSLENASIFVTTRPCLQCTLALIQSGIKAIYFDEDYQSDSQFQFTNFCEEAKVNVYQLKQHDV